MICKSQKCAHNFLCLLCARICSRQKKVGVGGRGGGGGKKAPKFSRGGGLAHILLKIVLKWYFEGFQLLFFMVFKLP
jgi:hypothetical protein